MMDQQAERGAGGGATFSGLLMMFGATGMAQLGVVPDPTNGQKRVDLEGAKHTIELLEVLEQKTVGNLAEPESQLLKEILFDLRLRYVEAAKAR
jgi:hypothetical protein